MPGSLLVVHYDSTTGGFRIQKIGSAQISDGAIVSAKIGGEAIGNAHLRSGDVQHIRLGGIGADDHHIQFTSSMHSFAHPSALIGSGAVVSAKIGANAVGAAHILESEILLNSLGAPTGAVNFNKQQATTLVVQNISGADPASPANGQIWLRTDL